jgi:polysaccharide deacetylase family protein (PEP-CTERM system associated)
MFPPPARPQIQQSTSIPAARPGQMGFEMERAVINAMSVDVEDYFHVSAFRPYIRLSQWDRYPLRLDRNLDAIMQLFERAGLKATFFWLGWAAERLPHLVRRLAQHGHEIASHGYLHIRVLDQQPEEFREDVRRTKRLLEDLSGQPVIGYRAASYSIDGRNLWALDVLGEEGYRYSSSVYPIRHDHYGMREAPRFAFRPRAAGVVEIPVTTAEFGPVRVPCGGGGYFRLLPYVWSRWCLTRVCRDEGQPAVFYFHPWELDPEQPRVAGIDARARFRHYVNLHGFGGKLGRLVTDFGWAPLREVFAGAIG